MDADHWGWIAAIVYPVLHAVYAAYRRLTDKLKASETRRLDSLEKRVERLETNQMR